MNRRAMLQTGLGAGLGTLATGALAAGFLPAARPAEGCETPAQTEGPFYPTREQPDTDVDLTRVQGRTDRARGDVVGIRGQVLDDALQPVAGALVEIWQANAHGRYHHDADPNPAAEDPAFQGWGRVRTGPGGHYSFTTIVPGAYPASETWMRPPHVHFKVAKRGYHELVTQMYFAGEALNDADRLLLSVPEGDRDRVVVALAEGAPHDDPPRTGVFNIVLQRVA